MIKPLNSIAMFKNMEHIVVQEDSMSSSSYQSTIPHWDFLHSTFNGISQILFKPVSIVDHFSSNTFSTGISPTNNTNESVLAPLLEIAVPFVHEVLGSSRLVGRRALSSMPSAVAR